MAKYAFGYYGETFKSNLSKEECIKIGAMIPILGIEEVAEEILANNELFYEYILEPFELYSPEELITSESLLIALNKHAEEIKAEHAFYEEGVI